MKFPRAGVLMTLFLLLGATFTVQAKRAAPKKVEPVVVGSIVYSAPLSANLMGFVVATDKSSGKELWRQRIYRVFINPFMEEDVQWVFISSLIQQDQALIISNERNECFRLELTTRKVTGIKCPARVPKGSKSDPTVP